MLAVAIKTLTTHYTLHPFFTHHSPPNYQLPTTNYQLPLYAAL
ncbi:hypothetical protein [Chroococcidiopsis sp. CCALA 051]|nr:hypothetical protein [Chroococcidiopsis sp. CCALA 051]